MRSALLKVAVGLVVLLLFGCAHTPTTIKPVSGVDLERFMGDWYVIAHIPSRFERDAFSAVESYSLRRDGRIATTFKYRKGSFDGSEKTMHPVGTVRAGTGNAVWDMRFFGVLNEEYVIVYLDDDYSLTAIGRSDRDYAWIMARTPSISDEAYDKATARLTALGYSLDRLRRVPQPTPPAVH